LKELFNMPNKKTFPEINILDNHTSVMILNNIKEEVMLLTEDFKIIWANKALINTRNVDENKIIGKACHYLYFRTLTPCSPDSCPISKAIKSLSLQKTIHCKKVKDKIIEVSIYPVNSSKDEIKLYLHIAKDITVESNQKKEIKTLVKSKNIAENERDNILNLTSDLICIAKMDGYFKYVNPAWNKTLAYSTDELLSKPFLDFIYPDDHHINDKEVEKLAKGLETINFVNRYIHKDGSLRYISWKAKAIADSKQIYCIGRNITAQKKIEEKLRKHREQLELIVLEKTKNLRFSKNKLEKLSNKLHKNLIDTVYALSDTVECRDFYTVGHSKNVSKIASMIADQMGLQAEHIEAVKLASILHDIGKIVVPLNILSKPEPLSKKDFEVIKTHPLKGYDLLKHIEFEQPIARIVLEHHERMNGSGYPNNKTGNDLLLESRILAVADVVEAMMLPRPYRCALGPKKAIEEITKNSGTLYDEDVVKACIKIYEKERIKDIFPPHILNQ
jgi:PAS domain S-box-containing protein/putative nucleotidyltransferase with HDIG domain